MNIELIRLKKKLAVMETEGSNQVFMDLLNLTNVSFQEETIIELRNKYKIQIAKLEQQESKYKQGQLL